MSATPVVAVRFKNEKLGYAVINEAEFDPSLHEKVDAIPNYWEQPGGTSPVVTVSPEWPVAEPGDASVVLGTVEETPAEKAKREAEESAVAVRRMQLEAMTKAELAALIVGMGVNEVREKTAKYELIEGILDIEAFRRQDAEMRAGQ